MARSTARAAVMQMIFENLAGGEGGEDTLQMVYEALRHEGIPGVEISEKEPGKSDRAYIARVLEGVLNNLDDLDAAIQEASPRWQISRMPKVDLTILRLATWEILHEEDVPGSVAINEAVKLATRYSEPSSGRFVNGVLGGVLRKKEAAQ
ncbi:MAG: transcription antitermination factor NusB [Clostridia bacterium]|nr:transcription antitermination factor NusB [Clostridia bacterium]